MLDFSRRGFLKLGSAIVGGLSLIKYAEPAVQIPHSHEWIDDKGDFVIVRVPAFKSFANELITKPAIFVLGERALVRAIEVRGYSNIYAPKGGTILGCYFDGSQMTTEMNRSVVHLVADNLGVTSCSFECAKSNTSAVSFAEYKHKLV